MKKEKHRQWNPAGLLLLLVMVCFLVLLIQPRQFVHADPAEQTTESQLDTEKKKDGQNQELVITVLDDIQAADIEESPIPMSAGPVSEKSSNIRHFVLYGVMLLCVLLYVLYLVSRKRKLSMLKTQAVDAEAEYMKLYSEKRNNQNS